MGGGPGLKPLEFTDCLTDSPYFREKLHSHEKELERTSQQIKGLIKEVKDLLNAARNLSRAQRTLSKSLINFNFECIGASQTDDEVHISHSLKEFGDLIARIEDQRDMMLERAYDQIILPLDNFRKGHIGGVKEGKKKFDKETAKFCQSQERYLNMSTKKQDTVLKEADASLAMEQRCFSQASLEYVFLLQEVQERKKFEFVETLMGFMYGWLTFYHEGHEVAKEFKPYMRELQFKIQKTRDNFNATRDQTETLMKKMLEVRQTKSVDSGSHNRDVREGYLFLMEKRAFGTTWTKHYCTYHKESKAFEMIPYNQMTGKFNSSETMVLSSCVRRMSDSIEKRFCFDVTSDNRPGQVFTLQALSEEDRKLWMDVMDGKEPVSPLLNHQHAGTYAQPTPAVTIKQTEERPLDDVGFTFVTRCIEVLENRGLEEQGLYRVVGVSSKVAKLLQMGLDRRKGATDKLPWLDDPTEWESKTITSALKTYLRNLPEPLMTFRYHNAFLAAAKQETRALRLNDVHTLIYRLPQANRSMLDLLTRHLRLVAGRCDKNLMTVSNLGVCFGPTLLRSEEETVAAIMETKFCNVVVEILIDNYDQIFKSPPEILPTDSRTSPLHSHSPGGNDLQNHVQANHSPPHGQRAINKYIPYSQAPLTQHTVIRTTYYDGPVPVSLGSLHSVRERDAYPKLLHPSAHLTNRIGQHPAYSESNLLTMSNTTPHYKNKSAFHYPNAVERDTMHSTSSSNESVSSVSSRDANNHNNYPVTSPQKTKRGGKLGVHYATSYRTDSLRVRTLYTCLSENDGELSFEPNQIITNVRRSLEPGWLEGTLNGKTGLVPENYVEFLP